MAEARLTLDEIKLILNTSRNFYGKDLSTLYLRNLDLSGANLSGANLSRANLSRADLDSTNLTGALIYGAQNIERARNIQKAKGLV